MNAAFPPREPTDQAPPFRDRRRTRRLLVPAVQVTLELPGTPSSLCVADALDVNRDGLGLVLPPEFEAGTEVLLTFLLDEHTFFYRVPGVVVRQHLGVGGVRFEGWSEVDRNALLAYLERR